MEYHKDEPVINCARRWRGRGINSPPSTSLPTHPAPDNQRRFIRRPLPQHFACFSVYTPRGKYDETGLWEVRGRGGEGSRRQEDGCERGGCRLRYKGKSSSARERIRESTGEMLTAGDDDGIAAPAFSEISGAHARAPVSPRGLVQHRHDTFGKNEGYIINRTRANRDNRRFARRNQNGFSISLLSRFDRRNSSVTLHSIPSSGS